MRLLLGSVVESSSPSGSFDIRNLVNVLFTGLLACIPVLLNSVILQIPTFNWGKYGWAVPFILMILKGISETYKGTQE